MLSLNIGMWSGFKRRTEISESFLQPMVTVSSAIGPCETLAANNTDR